MILMVLLVVLTSSVCGMNVTFYQAEEDDDITIRWDIHTKTDMSLTIIDCFLLSKPEKCLYRMVNSVDAPESQDQQFAGRVQCDKDALRDGRIRLLLSRLRTEDSGHYWCDLAANYNKTTRGWGLLATEQFVLNVTSRGEKMITPASTKDAEPTPGSLKKEVVSYDLNEVVTGAVLLVGAMIVLLAAAQRCLAVIRRSNEDRHRD